MRALMSFAGSILLGLGVGCGGGGPAVGGATASVQGNLSPTARPLDNARAIAVGADGRVFWSYLDVRGSFALTLPVDQSYRVLVADTLAGGGLRTIAHLVVHPSTGATRWMGIHQGGVVSLGALRPLGASGGKAAGSLATLDDPAAGDPSSSGDDGSQQPVDTHEDDHGTDGLCSSQGDGQDDDEEVDAQDDPGDQAADDNQSEHETESADEDGAACSPDAGGGSGSSGGGSSGGSSSSGGASGGGAIPAGGACTVSANCAAGLVCSASVCRPVT